ncbi:MAG: crossover junction endodeoxyribonuclease RuvC [Pirellulaceae bacterium]|jgi:crossover junction endodeoxyribonuclease RuvC|nr:crossover junction endodeoxyribonuclease RuvC [Pirellulaceae bacterium]HJN11491.1 crossover junction endodeoxyribonuclease RuvC [Pirellulaceae bacterium]
MSDTRTEHEQLILGVDPGLNITGYGVLRVVENGFELVEAGVIRARPRNSMGDRLKELHAGIFDVVQSFSPTSMALEELYSHYARPRTSILMGHARGVICLAAAQNDVPIVNYAATQVKRILTGNGRAPKSQMQDAICREFGLLAPPEPPDVADALAIALCHHYLGAKAA